MKHILFAFCILIVASASASANKWPRGNKPASHNKLAASVKSAVKSAYKLERKTSKAGAPKPIAWKGPEVGKDARVAIGSAAQLLSPAGLAAEASKGRDPMDAIISVALSLGVEQGQRMLKSDTRLTSALAFARLGAAGGDPAMSLIANLLEQALKADPGLAAQPSAAP